MVLEELAALRVFAWRRGALFVRLVYGDMLVEDIERVLGGRELDGEHALAVVDGLGGALAQLGALSVGSAVLVEQRVVAVVGEAEAVVFSAVPAVVEAVAVAVDALDRVDAALGNGALLAHLLLGVCRGLQCLHDAQADLGVRLLAAIVCARVGRVGCLGKGGQGQRDGGVCNGLEGVLRAGIGRGEAIGRLVARGGVRMLVLVVEVLLLLLLLLRLDRDRVAQCRGRDHEGGADPEGQLGLGVLGLVGRAGQILAQ